MNRHTFGSRIAIAFVAVVAIIFATSIDRRQAVQASATWPATLSYEINFATIDSLDAPMGAATGNFSGNGWRDWTNEIAERGETVCTVRRRSGEVLRGPSCDQVSLLDVVDSDEPSLPNSYLRPLEAHWMDDSAEHSYSSHDPENLDREAVANRLSIRLSDVAAVARTSNVRCSDTGFAECRGAEDVVRTIEIVHHTPTGLPLAIVETVDGVIVRSFAVTSLSLEGTPNS